MTKKAPSLGNLLVEDGADSRGASQTSCSRNSRTATLREYSRTRDSTRMVAVTVNRLSGSDYLGIVPAKFSPLRFWRTTQLGVQHDRANHVGHHNRDVGHQRCIKQDEP